MLHGLAVACCSLALALLTFCALSDLRVRRIPNAAALAIAITFLAYCLITSMPWSQFLWHVAVGGLAFVLGTACFAAGWLGGGDVKLAAAVLLWAGPHLAPLVMVATGFIGIVVALAGYVIQRFEPKAGGSLPAPIAVWSARSGVPYGVGLSVGGALVILAVL